MNSRVARALLLTSVCLSPAWALEGRVLDSKGGPIAGALVASLLPADKVPKDGANFVETLSGTTGNFSLDTKGATSLLMIAKDGFATAYLKSPAGDAPLSISLTPGVTLTGTVIATKSGKPIAGASVLARGTTSQFVDPKQPDRFATKAKSGTDGRYAFNHLADDFYSVEASASGFARAWRRNVAVAVGSVLPTVNLTLTDGTSLGGDVRDSAGKPLQNATVRVLPRADSLRGTMLAANSSNEGKTDAKGNFTVENIPVAERYSVAVSHPDQTTLLVEELRPTAAGRIAPLSLTMPTGATVTSTVKAPDGSLFSGKLKLSLTPKQQDRSVFDRTQQPQTKELEIKNGVMTVPKLMAGKFGASVTVDGYMPWTLANVQLKAGESVDLGEILLQAGELLEGSVQDAQQHPVNGATVRLFAKGRGYQAIATATTDSQGRFRLAGAPTEGELRLTAFKAGAGTATQMLEKPPTEPVSLALEPPVTIRGRVLIGNPPKPLSVFTASLILSAPDDTSPLPPMLRGENVRATAAVRDAAGQFSIEADKAGIYAVKIQADGFVPGRVDGLAATAGSAVDAGEIALSPGATLQVQVVEKGSGVAIAGASVGIQEPGLLGMMAGMDMSKQAGDPITGTDGSAALSSLPPGNHIVRVSHDGYAKTTATATIEPDQRVASLRIEVPLGGTLEGVVRNEKGVPLVGAMVMPQQGMMPDPAKSATTDDQGRYRIEHLPGGSYMVMVIPLDNLDESSPEAAQSSVMGRMKMQSIEVVDKKIATLNFPATQVIAVSGVVKRGSKPIAATLMWLKQGAGSMATTNTDDSGAYKVEITSPGSYMVMITPKGERTGEFMANASLSVEVPEGQAVFTKDLVLSEDKLTGTVRDGARGDPLSQARLMALPIDANGAYDDKRQGMMRQAVTDAEGHFSMEALTEGRWRITASKQGYGNLVLPEMNIKDGASPNDLDVPLFPARERTLRVVNDSGNPVAGAMAFGLTSFSGAEMMVTSDQDGQLKLANLADGTHDLIVVAPGYAPHALKNLAVDEDSAANTELVMLSKGETVMVKIVDEAREPVRDATISRLLAPEIGDFGIAFGMISISSGGIPRSGVDGIVTLIPLEPGNYEVSVIAGSKRGNAKFEIKSGKKAEVSVTVR